MALAESRAPEPKRPEYRRLATDIAVQADLGRFFGAKFRAGVLYHIFEKTGDRAALEASLKCYRGARDAWAAMADRTQGVYLRSITFGPGRPMSGHWADRLKNIDTDIARVAAKLDSAKPAQTDGLVPRVIKEATGRPPQRVADGRHNAPGKFQRGQAIALEFAAGRDYSAVQLLYRRVNHAGRWQSAPMQSSGRLWRGTIPADYADSAYSIQYYFELREPAASAGLFPGLGEQRDQQPYFVVRALS